MAWQWQPWHANWQTDAGMLLLALALDLALPEPPSAVHPVVWMGKATAALERLARGRGNRAALVIGAGIALAVPLAFGGAAWLAMVGLRQLGELPYLIGGAVLLKTTFAARGLARAASDTQRAVASGESDAARRSLRSLVSRDADALTMPLAAAAAIESVAENTTDSFIAPWLAFALLGLPGAFAYRALNTLDSMIGYRGRYEYLGKASARLDDVANLLPARIAALALLAAGAAMRLGGRRGGGGNDGNGRGAGVGVGGGKDADAGICDGAGAGENDGAGGVSVGRGWRVMLRDRGLSASPNAGWTIGAMSGLLGAALEKPGHYRIGGEFGEPGARHIGMAARLAYGAAAIGVALAAGVIALRGLGW